MQPRPLVGISADRRVLDPHPFHVVGEKYITAIRDGADAVPFIIPALGDSVDGNDILAKVDGIFLTGSASNVEPQHYAGDASRTDTLHDSHRDETFLNLIPQALETGVPLLAVCRGFQELNVVLGGTLHQHVHEQPGYQDHRENKDDPLEVQYGPAHEVHLVESGLLRKLAGKDTVTVNSVHGQGAARLAKGVTVEAVANDGLVEAFRVDGSKAFALAVQWHPEWRVTENEFSMAIFAAFGDACRAYAAQKTGDM